MVTYAKMTSYPIPPVWQASFPGSGARMTWTLVEALTGIRTNNDYDSQGRGYEHVVAVKTHYPVKDARRRFGDLDPLFGRAIVILRNPMNAIPSYFNLLYGEYFLVVDSAWEYRKLSHFFWLGCRGSALGNFMSITNKMLS